ncbi:TerC family protein [Rhodospirillaceae bacterium KN72]|uniref:TerC family protein n=1 Tax=Pacificispira spongiicola TaxID=2729598 RepID=A0A7Y0E3K1_9PROT|nr:TerC family protein [Pacificispira spongiicola]NMM46605.1 TerC family protein [Pacificispira spongiicola]
MEVAHLIVSPEAWLALGTLIVMEVVLGIDNLVFISILTNKLPEDIRPKARMVGLSGALILRLVLLSLLFVLVGLTTPVFTLWDHGFSWRDLILLAGGLFLVWKATTEIHHHVDPDEDEEEGTPVKKGAGLGFGIAIVQILLLDLVFSVDSILTAVGMTTHLPIMFAAVITSVILMLFASGPLANFINKNPTVVMLALSFLLMIGMLLIAEGFGFHVPKGYVYAAMAFSGLVEGLNMLARRARKKRAPST